MHINKPQYWDNNSWGYQLKLSTQVSYDVWKDQYYMCRRHLPLPSMNPFDESKKWNETSSNEQISKKFINLILQKVNNNKKIYSTWKGNGRKEIYSIWKHVKHNDNKENITYLKGNEIKIKGDLLYFIGKEIRRALLQKQNHTSHKVICRKGISTNLQKLTFKK